MVLTKIWRRCAQHDGPQSLDEVAALVQAALLRQAPMLAEYFGINISTDGALQTLPQLIEVRKAGRSLETVSNWPRGLWSNLFLRVTLTVVIS